MLALSRKVGEKLVINENVTITITRLSGNRVTIGIDAPQEVPIRRSELEPHHPAMIAYSGVECEEVVLARY